MTGPSAPCCCDCIITPKPGPTPTAGSPEQIARFASPEPVEWREWLRDAIVDWRDEWLPVLENLGAPASGPARSSEHAGPEAGAPSANEKAAELAGDSPAKLPNDFSREPLPKFWRKSLRRTKIVRRAKKARSANRLKNFFADAAFLHSLMPTEGSREPLAEDWDWIRGHMTALLQLAQEFGQKFAERKRADGVLDFHDLEQFALKLLWDSASGKPTAIAERWRQKIRFVFVDEYQDINAAQDKIIQALSRDLLGVPPSGGTTVQTA